MDEYTFEDAIALSSVSCTYPGLEAISVSNADADQSCTSLFFPGCSFVNYALPLVKSVYDLLESGGQADGISLLCCGKILDFEGDGGVARAAFEEQFISHVTKTQIKRIVAACPNCVRALRQMLAKSEATSGIEVVPLPRVLVDMLQDRPRKRRGFRARIRRTARGRNHRLLSEGLMSRPRHRRIRRCPARDHVRYQPRRAEVRPQALVLLRFAPASRRPLRPGRQDGTQARHPSA